VETKAASREDYVRALIQEIKSFKYKNPLKINSINFGGGTPMLLSEDQVTDIIAQLQETFPSFKESVEEISMEATPESVTDSKIANLKRLGFNRISIGVQSFNESEIRLSKRHNLPIASDQAIKIIREQGIENLCCDLMYGLQGQTLESWFNSVQSLLNYRPETIELYRTVIIPDTGLFRINNAVIMSPEEKYIAYEYARDQLLTAGYIQDSHVRFVLPKRGFYHQQANVFKDESLIGFGVGARSYAENVHYRNSYGKNSRTAIARYIDAQNNNSSAVETAVFFTQEEKLRRYVIYNLEALNRKEIQALYQYDIYAEYESTWNELEKRGLVLITDNTIKLTDKATYFRDTIASFFFSKENHELESAYYRNYALA
jgi:oxygen-independent coproporphyrinogen-3 oxidase